VPAHEFEGPGLPAWPWRGKDETLWDKDRLRAELIVNWKALADRGVPVHVGEWGCFSATPHDVTLAWMEDMLSLWKEVGWGWALWNFRGSFGVLDSGRKDVRYEKLGKHLLDRRMLELLRAG
jgi:endoglucanase